MCCVSVVAHCINSSISEQIYITNIVLLWNIRGATNLVWSRGVFMITFMDQTIRLNTQSIHRPLFLLRRHSLYVDKKYKAWRVVGRGWNVKRKRSLGLLPSLIFHIVSPSDMGSFKATLASLMQLMYIENGSSLFWSQTNISHFSLSNIVIGM